MRYSRPLVSHPTGGARGAKLFFKESGSSPTSPPRRTYSSLASVSAETTFYWACHFRFSLAQKFPFLEIEKPIAETQEAEDEMLPSPFAEFLRQDAEWRFQARALRGG